MSSEPSSSAGSALAAAGAREGPARRVTLDPPPFLGPQFTTLASRRLPLGSSRLWSRRPLHAPLSRPPSRPAYAGRRPLRGRPPSPSAAAPHLLLHPRPGSLAGAAAGPVTAKLADPNATATAAATTAAAVRPRAAPPPSWPRPTRWARPRRALSPSRQTHAEARPQDRFPLNPAP